MEHRLSAISPMWKLRNGLYSELELEKYGVLNFTSTAVYGDMKCGENRRKFLKKYFGIKRIVSGIQTHSSNIKIISDIRNKFEKKCHCERSEAISVLKMGLPPTTLRRGRNDRVRNTDGFITNIKNLPLAVFTADCLPVFIYDKVKKIIGLVHAGRAGLEKSIVEKAADIFIKDFGSNPRDIFTAAGPHIKKCCYGVDLDKIAKNQLNGKGIKKISFAGVCTHGKEFFSYRKNKTKKRMLSVMMLKDDYARLKKLI